MFVEYAKADPEDILIRITVHNRGPEAARLHVLPTLWFRNTWSWGDGRSRSRRCAQVGRRARSKRRTTSSARTLLHCDGEPELLFTENETQRRAAVGPAQRRRRTSRTRSTRIVVGGRPRRGQPARRSGPRRPRTTTLEVPAGGQPDGPPAAAPPQPAAGPFNDFDADRSPSRHRRRGRVLRADHAAVAERGPAARPPSGARRHAVEQAVLLLRSRQWLEEHKSHPLLGRCGRRAKHRVVPHAQRRHHLDARQVGVPLVRGVGSGVPHRRAGAGRLRLRQGSAAADAARACTSIRTDRFPPTSGTSAT